jgi:ComF family protein
MINALLQLFFPQVCAGCDKLLLHSESVICTLCRHEMPLTLHQLQPDNEAFRKFYGRIGLENVSCFLLFHKKGIVQELIHKLKYKDCEAVGSCLGEWFAPELEKSGLATGIDAIIPVPLHPKKLRKRGYNQVSAFGKALSLRLDIPFNDQLLERRKYSKTQTQKDLFGRSEINTALFGVNFTHENHNLHFLLIDDVLTTGSTIEACARALLTIPGTKVSVACMAYAGS